MTSTVSTTATSTSMSSTVTSTPSSTLTSTLTTTPLNSQFFCNVFGNMQTASLEECQAYIVPLNEILGGCFDMVMGSPQPVNTAPSLSCFHLDEGYLVVLGDSSLSKFATQLFRVAIFNFIRLNVQISPHFAEVMGIEGDCDVVASALNELITSHNNGKFEKCEVVTTSTATSVTSSSSTYITDSTPSTTRITSSTVTSSTTVSTTSSTTTKTTDTQSTTTGTTTDETTATTSPTSTQIFEVIKCNNLGNLLVTGDSISHCQPHAV
eukprot:m.349169 g.349169  ORF g.349169 m.349169 type:complete len:266 (-) comp40606_c0_seq1:59-856(-)